MTTSYVYDGDGRPVKKVAGGVTTVYVYNASGQLVAEHSEAAATGSGRSYITADHLGSPRVVTDASGAVKKRHDYLPFGEEIEVNRGSRTSVAGFTSHDGLRQKFTSKERDNESGLDYFGARYYSGAQGRLTSVDPGNAGANVRDAQSWNGYAYARNNPLIYIDPNGMWYWLYDMKANRQFISDANAEEWQKKDGVVFKGGKIFDKDGKQLGTYRRMWDDSASELFNLTFYGREGLVARSDAMQQAIGGFAVGTAVIGASGGAAAYFGGVALSGSGITTLGLSEGGGTIAGLYGTTTVATLQSLASSGGPTVQVVTNLTRAPVAGQGLSTATGPGAEALANSFARAGGQLFRAEIPKALVKELERVGLAEVKGHATGTEIQFLPQATRFITQFFK